MQQQPPIKLKANLFIIVAVFLAAAFIFIVTHRGDEPFTFVFGDEMPPMPTLDHAGYRLNLPENIQTVAALDAFNIVTMGILGTYEMIVSMEYDIEELLALRPDIVFGTRGMHDLSRLRNAGISVALMPPWAETTYMDVLFIARILQVWERGLAVITVPEGESHHEQ